MIDNLHRQPRDGQLSLTRGRFPRFRLWVLALVLGWALPAAAQEQAILELDSYSSDHYVIHTNLTKKEARIFGKHMDRVFKAYQRKFSNLGLAARNNTAMPLYLLRTREQYIAFMANYGINATNTGGMFFYRKEIQGLSTFTQGRPATETFAILQHEGFHQFAFKYMGANLPIWVNEGLAQYFEDGIFVKKKLQLDLANARRIESVKAAVRNGRDIGFDRMLSMSDDKWSSTLAASPSEASLLYDQAWSMVFFLATARRGRYVKPFRQYLVAVANGTESMQAFHSAFKLKDVKPFQEAWRDFALEAEPDMVNIVMERLNFLGHALRFMSQRDMPMPRTTAELRNRLQKMRYRAIRTSHGLTTEISSMDESVYRYPVGREQRYFRMLKPARPDLPPSLAAPRLKPEPIVVWSRDGDGQLMQDIAFR